MELKWYTIFTKPNLEKKVTASLTRKQILHFCPINFAPKQKSAIKNYDTFSGYVFVKISESQITDITKIEGIKNFMYWLNKPAVISENEIDLIKDFLNKHTHVKMEKREVGFKNDIAYSDDAHKENQAKLIHLNHNKIKAVLPSLGYIMIAEFEKSTVRLPAAEDLITNAGSKSKFGYRLAR